MDDTNKLIKIVINNQSKAKEDYLELRKDMNGGFTKIDSKIDKVEKNLTKRIDKAVYNLAELEDDAPTREEFDELKEKVEKISKKFFATA